MFKYNLREKKILALKYDAVRQHNLTSAGTTVCSKIKCRLKCCCAPHKPKDIRILRLQHPLANDQLALRLFSSKRCLSKIREINKYHMLVCFNRGFCRPNTSPRSSVDQNPPVATTTQFQRDVSAFPRPPAGNRTVAFPNMADPLIFHEHSADFGHWSRMLI